VSDSFSIASTTGIPPEAAVFSLKPVNPAVGAMTIRLGLAAAENASLGLYDVGGRRVAYRDLRSARPGWQTLQFRGLPPGVYHVQLSQEGRTLVSRVVVIR